MHGKRAALLILILILLSPITFALSSRAQIVDYDWVDSIENLCLEIDAKTTAEVVICVLPSLYGHGIKDKAGNEINDIVKLGIHIFNDEPLEVYDGTQTGIGKAGKDNGVLLLVALEQKQYRFEVGYGLEGDITDIETNLIAEEYLVPAFKSGDYGVGLYDTVVALGEQIPSSTETLPLRGVYLYESDVTSPQPESAVPFWLIDVYGLPLWAIIILAIVGIAGAGVGGSIRGGRSGGGGSTGRW